MDLPQTFLDGPVDADGLRARARDADDLGFDGAWVSEDVLNESGTLDALTTLAYAAAVTSRVDLGVAVLLGPLYNPAYLANATATLDQLSGGRTILGLGLGGDTGVYPAFGVPPTARAARFDQLVTGLYALWAGAEPAGAEPIFDVRGQRMRPRPCQAPHPPVWFGGSKAGALRRATRFGDGFIGSGTSSRSTFAVLVERLRALLAEREPRAFTIAKRVYVGCNDHVSDADTRLHSWLARRYGRPMPAGVAVTGDAAACRDGLRRLVDAGADYLVLSFGGEHERSYDGAARDFLAQLRSYEPG